MSLKIGILGWPLTKTLSPSIHNMLAEFSSVDLVYEKLPVENLNAEKLDDIHAEYDGYNVTIPHKRKIYDLIKSKDRSNITEFAQGTQAVNTVVLKNSTVHATNTDIEGIKKTFESINYDLRNKKILILGNGGSTQTFNYFCDSSNEVIIASRQKDKDTKLYSEILNLVPEIQVLVNTTPIGMPPFEDELLPVPYELFENLELFFNFGYKTNSKLTEGFSQNVQSIDGITMLIGQAISSFSFWTGQEIKFDHVYHEILERLKNED